MTTTGRHTVLTASAPVHGAVRRFLDGWLQRWPYMRVNAEDGSTASGFQPWREQPFELTDAHRDVLVVRDGPMEFEWDDHGFELADAAEGPFMITWTPGGTEVTVVTPGSGDEFSRQVIDALAECLAGDR